MSINIKKDGKLVKIAPTSYNELTDLPNIESSGDVTYITDESGKNVATIGPGGLSTTGIVVDRITLDGEDVGTKLDSIKGEIDFNDLTNNPISDNDDGTVSFADESGNKIVLIDSEGVTSVEFKADKHKLTEKADQSYVEDQITRLEASAFSGDYNDLENAPIINDATGSAVFADEQDNQIAKIDAEGVTSVEFIAGTHKLTNKAEKDALLADFTEDSEHQTVTSAEKTYWSNKSEFSGKFGDLTDSPIIDDNSGELIYTDGTNTIVKIDASGITTTNVAIKEGDVATLISEKADQTSLDATNNTVTATNATVSVHTTEIGNLKTEVANDKTALETFKTETAGNFTAVNKRISDTNDAVDVLENKVSINEEKLEGVQASDGEFTITDGTNIGMKLDSEGLLHVREVEVAGGRVDERLKDIENYFSTEEDADSNLNKWHEIVDFLNGFEETDQVLENIINTKASKDELSALSTKVDNNNTSVNTRIDVVETAYKAADTALQEGINKRALQTALDSTNQEVSNIKNNYVTKAEIAAEVKTEHLEADNITLNQDSYVFTDGTNKIAEIDSTGVSSTEFTAGSHQLTKKADTSYVGDQITSINSSITTTAAAIRKEFADADSELSGKIDKKADQTAVDAANSRIDTIANTYATKKEIATEVDTDHLITDRITLNDDTFIFTDNKGDGHKIAEINNVGVTSVEFVAGEHRLTDKADLTVVEEEDKKLSDKITALDDSIKKSISTGSLTVSGTISAKTIVVDGENIKDFMSDNYVSVTNPTAFGNVSFGRKSQSTIGNKSVVIGNDSVASAENSIAIGSGSTASGANSTVIGSGSIASGLKSVALGEHNTASGEYSFATGCWTTSNGIAGTTLGNASVTNANSWCALSSGIHTEARGLVQHVFGMNNIPDAAVSGYSTPAEHLLIVGNGDYLSSDTYESNAMTLDWDGNAWFSGNVYVGSTSGTNKDSGSIKLATENQIPTESTVSGWGFTKNNGTITKVSTGSGLIGGDITSTGTIECNLVDFTQNTSAASASGSDDNNRLYPVSLDKNGKLSVKVPWVKVSLSEDNAELNEALSNYITKTDIDNYIPTLNGGQKATTGKYVSGVTVSGHTVTVTQENLPEEQYKGTVTSIMPGTGLTGASSDAAITNSGTINLKTAATGEIGGIKVGSVSTTSSGANKTINTNKFAVHVDKDGLGYVAIPEYSNGTGSITKVTAGTGLTGGASSGEAILNVNIKDVNKNSKAAVKGNNSDQLYAVELDKDGKLAVSVPWKSTTFEGNTELEGLLEPYALKTDIPSIAGSGFATTSSDQDTNTITVNVSVPNASTSTSGLMSAADKVRLDGIEDNANNYVHPSVNHIPAGGSSGQFLKYKSSGEAQWYTLKSSDIPAHTHSYVTSVTAGEGLNNNGTDTAPSLSVRLAEDDYIGGFKTGFENNKNNRNYGVKIDSSTGKAYVNVPWEAVDFSGNAELSALLGDYAKKGDIPSLSGGSAAGSDTTVVGGVTVNGHTVSVGKKTITGAGTVSVTGTTTGITITGTHPDSLKNPYSLKFGSKTYDGSSEKEITAADLGLGAALKYRGVTTTNVVDDRTTANVTIDSKTHTPSTGDVVFYGNKEFVWNGSKWEELGYANTLTLNKVTTDGPSGTSSVASSGHTHSVTASGSVSSSFTGSAVNTGTPSSNTTSVATGAHTHGTSSNGDHTHTVTATGSVSSSFTGTAVNTGTDSSNVASVSLDSHKHTISATGTSSRTTVPTTSHTHTVAISGSGSFTGTAGNTGGPSANIASVASGTHTHSVTGTVQSGGASHTHTYDTYSLSASASGGVLTISLSTGSGNVGYTTASHTHVFASGSASATATTSRFDVPNTSHTHSFTPSGSVSFSGSNATTGAASTASGHTVSVATGAHVHSMGTAVANDSTSSVSVSTSSHKHSVTASGSVSSSFTGTSATTSKNGSHSHTANASTDNTTNRVSVPNTSHTHSVTAAGSVSSSFTGTAVTSGTPSGTTSVGSSSHTHTVTPTGSIS